jgi:hypothetical protein
VTAFASGISIALYRLRARGAVAGLVFALLCVAIVALLERRAAALEAPDRALEGIAFGIALPLTAYAVAMRSFSRSRIDASLAEIARHGGSRRSGVAGSVLVVMLSAAVCGALFGLIAVVVTRAPHDALLLRDAFTSTWIGALGGLAYGAWFSLGSQFGANGGGRFWFLILDWILGDGTSLGALPMPRAHIENLIGLPPVMSLPQWTSTVALAVLACLCLGLSMLRAPR